MRLSIIIILFLAVAQISFAQTGEGLAASPVLADYARFEAAETFYASAEYAAALPGYARLSADFPGSLLLPRAQLMVGKSYFNLKGYGNAIKAFRGLLAKYPEAKEAAEARYLIARALEKQNNWRGAYLAYEETDLTSPLSYFGREARLAIARLKKAHRKKLPKLKVSAQSLFKKGMAYFEQDDFETASNIFNRLARQYPKSKYVDEAWLMLGRAEMQTGSPAAIGDLERAAQGPPNLAGRATYYLGLAHGRRGSFDKAIAAMNKVVDRYPESDLADAAAYWSAFYREVAGDVDGALQGYYGLIKKYPYSESVPAAIWRLGRAYYWRGDWQNASTSLHMAQIYPPGEDTPRCYFFEAKAQERLGNRAAAAAIYEKLAQRFDHSYYAYRAKDKLMSGGYALAEQTPFNGEEFSAALKEIAETGQEELAAIMEIWEQTNNRALESESSEEARAHLAKYKELMNLGFAGYAADEARYLVNLTSVEEKESAQARLGEMLISAGNYKTPIRFADRRVKAAVMAGKPGAVSKKVWQLAYPKGYWQHVANGAKIYGLDPYLVLAVIREESRFNPKATSRSSARGLMQIMPKTGRGIAEDLDIKRYRTTRLYEPKLNVEMGIYYLSCLIKNFSSNAYLALAGYNGGPNKIKKYVKNWYNDNLATVDIDEFIESIPSRETRLYVQKVMGSYFEYKRLYERKRG
ncbi:hypothetical protein A2625_05320 [candidate division WOR-1 bacterium RIFCSPHIGHO2_01_FULL_53_15]|uniref:Transglycosylase SLT domain-containing protein n=1 Tax=candidate division WOR-1 bacterium RIFCSPHIGHO2_01_FULL_53_15 TaxID=1802564 RepID=A0A1F4Q3M6_UNCSA|nr:MAG: hypothetical protein A2625_05320 [candidate division WOR-1 bacterium RIFCSPHIGHO2_01_FULL_53_15]